MCLTAASWSVVPSSLAVASTGAVVAVAVAVAVAGGGGGVAGAAGGGVVVAWAAAPAGAAVAGCGTSSPPREDARVSTAAIQGGEIDTTHKFAVGVCAGGAGPGDCAYICSGALIAPNLVVTARHCFQDAPDPLNVHSAT